MYVYTLYLFNHIYNIVYTIQFTYCIYTKLYDFAVAFLGSPRLPSTYAGIMMFKKWVGYNNVDPFQYNSGGAICGTH